MEFVFFIVCIIFVFAYIFYKAVILEIKGDFKGVEEKIKPPYAVLSVKNSEDCIEGIVRSIARQIQAQTAPGYKCINDLVVIDLGSNDNTLVILNKLCSEYDFLHTVSKKQYLESVSRL